MFRSHATGLRLRLMLLVVLALLPMFGLFFFHAAEDRAKKLNELQDEATRLAELAAGSIGQTVEGARQMLRTIASTEEVRTLNGPTSSALFADLLDESATYHNIGLLQPDGLTIASAVPLNKVFNLGDRPWFIRLQEHRDFTIGEFQISRFTNKPTLIFAYPLPGQPSDKPLSVVYAGLNLASLQSSISRPHLTPKSVIAVLDRNGTELARHPDAAKWTGKQAKSWAMFQAQGMRTNTTFETAGVDGVVRFYHYVPVPGTDNSLFVNVGVSKEAVTAAVRADFLSQLGWLAILTGVALLCAWFFADISVLRHVRQLIDSSQRLAKGNWDAPSKSIGGARELQQLAHSFGEMAATLRAHRSQLEEEVQERTFELSRTNVFLTDEISERKQAEAAANKLLIELKRSNEELEQFAYVASHDLQEPLRLVSAYTQLLLKRYREKLDSDADPIVNFITEGVNRMQQLIQDLLAYSRVSSQNRPPSLADLAIPLESALRNLAMTIQEHGAEITHDPLPTLLCDATKLGQLFQNLIANGIKFHGTEPPRIHIGARKTDDGGAWLFSVSDNGIGIEPDYFERIFVIFQRLHTRSKYPGTGIGLAICKRIVEHHGGKIWVECEKNNGCIFSFTIPIRFETI